MFDEIRDALKEEKMPYHLRVPFLIASGFLKWFVWVFVGVGLLLNKEYFLYWFVFGIIVFSAFLIFIIVALSKILKLASSKRFQDKNEAVSFFKKVLDGGFNGVIGTISFYVFVYFALWFIKITGIVDQILSKIIDSAK